MNQLATINQSNLPAHLQAPGAAAAIAAENAAAAGGIKVGGFPRISIKGSKFHIKSGGETVTLFNPAAPGQPQLPKMILEAVIVSANPSLVKTYYPGDYADGDDAEPTCSSTNGVTPDAHIVVKQAPVCATCPQNQWGSKISKASGKEVKACSDSKQLAIVLTDVTGVPAALIGKAIGLSITPAALTDWGKYVKEVSDRGIPINAIVTNIMFDANAAFPKLVFTFNRFLDAESYGRMKALALSDEIKMIVAPSARPLQLAAPAPIATAPASGGTSVPAPIAPAAVSAPVGNPAAVAPVEASKPTRAPRGAKAAAQPPAQPTVTSDPGGPYDNLPPHVKLAVDGAGGLDTPAGVAVYKALAGKDYVAAAAPAADPFAGLPAHVKMAVDGAGGLGTVPGDATYAALAGKPAPSTPAPAPVVAPPISAPAAVPAPVAGVPLPVATTAVPQPGTGAPVASAQSVADLAARLREQLSKGKVA